MFFFGVGTFFFGVGGDLRNMLGCDWAGVEPSAELSSQGKINAAVCLIFLGRPGLLFCGSGVGAGFCHLIAFSTRLRFFSLDRFTLDSNSAV
jgi:hypothetical protein